jgi:hypothetical protein
MSEVIVSHTANICRPALNVSKSEGDVQSVDEITERVAMEIVEGYNDLVSRGLTTSTRCTTGLKVSRGNSVIKFKLVGLSKSSLSIPRNDVLIVGVDICA